MITHQIKQENFEEFSACVKRTFAEFPAKVMEKTIDIMQRGMKLITNSCRKRIGIQDSPLYLQFLYHQKKYISFVFKIFSFGLFYHVVLFCSNLENHSSLQILVSLCCVY